MKVRIEKKSSETIVYFIGHFDETAEDSLNQLVGQSLSGSMRFDFLKVESWNSLGVAAWLEFHNRIQSMNPDYANCSGIMLDLAQMISNFLVTDRVVSYLAAVSCDSCNKVSHVSLLIPFTEALTCAHCDTKLSQHPEIDEHLELLNDSSIKAVS